MLRISFTLTYKTLLPNFAIITPKTTLLEKRYEGKTNSRDSTIYYYINLY